MRPPCLNRQSFQGQTCRRGAANRPRATIFISACFALVALSGCAAFHVDPVLPDRVGVESIHSSRARVTSVLLQDHAGQLAVTGRLQKRHRGRSPLPGHLHIEAIGADGQVLEDVVSTYRRLSANTGTLAFSQRLAVPSAQVSRVRVTHHLDHPTGADAAAVAEPQASSGGARIIAWI